MTASNRYYLMARDQPATLLLNVYYARPAELAFIAEAVGTIDNPHLTIHVDATLLFLSFHPKGFVREGAVYGMQHRGTVPMIDRIRQMSTGDPDADIRSVAFDALEDTQAEGKI